MVLSYYLIKFPYSLIWRIRRLFGGARHVVFYCGDTLDYAIFQPVQKRLRPLPVVAKDRKVQAELAQMGVKASLLPVFPAGVIMCRQAAYKFPHPQIRKVGMRHGAYHFKPFANAKGYNMLDKFFMTSTVEVTEAQAAGIDSAVAVGYPKLDAAFNGEWDAAWLTALRERLGLDNRPTVLFTATWNGSGIAAIDRWYDRLEALTERYNLLVTVHPWTPEEQVQRIRNTTGVYFIDEDNAVPYIMLADVCVGDTSSIIAECCALDKPLVTFRVPDNKRTVAEAKQIIEEISLRIDSFDELPTALQAALDDPQARAPQRAAANKRMFDELDGRAGERAAAEIVALFPGLRLPD